MESGFWNQAAWFRCVDPLDAAEAHAKGKMHARE